MRGASQTPGIRENLLKTGPSSTTLTYDPLTRLYQSVSGTTTSRFAYDGLNALAEYSSTNALQRRWVYDPGGQPVLWYEGTGLTNRRFLSADERGSIISTSDSTGAKLAINTYDEYGNPAATNSGRYGYTGQAWLPSVTLWYYRARVYEPQLGRFLQPDPIGYAAGANLYAYVRNDSVNNVDPTGLSCAVGQTSGVGTAGESCLPIDVVGQRLTFIWWPRLSYLIIERAFDFGGEGGFGEPTSKSQDDPICEGGVRVTGGFQGSATGFLATFGLSGSVEVGISMPVGPSDSWNPIKGAQLYTRATGLGLTGLGFFAGAGTSRVGGYNLGPLRTGVETTTVAQGEFATGEGGEAQIAMNGTSAALSGGARAGMGGYLAFGAGKTATFATPQLGCP